MTQLNDPLTLESHASEGLPLSHVNTCALPSLFCYFSEEHIALAILRLIEMEKAVVEGAGAIGLAAILANQVPELKGKKCVAYICYIVFSC